MRFLSLLLALVMVVGLMPVTARAAEGDSQTVLSVTARYTTNRLSWDADGVTYNVQRSEDGLDWEQIGTSSDGAYLDTNAGLGTRYYYRLTTADTATEAVQGETTGMAALKKIAVLFYAGNDETAFDGSNKVAIAEGDKAAELNRMESGTIVYKANITNPATKQGVLGTNNNCYVGAYASKFRHELGGLNGETGYTGMVSGANTAGFIYDDSNGHWALCANGGAITSVNLNKDNFGILTAVNAETYYAGGSPSYPLNGTINYILVLSEVLTDNELKVLTGANLNHDEVATLPLGTNIGMMMDYSGTENNSNSWMFDGGSTTAGSFTEIGPVRSYVYQFEEYVRGKKMAAVSTGWNSRQRYTISVGKAGQTLADSLAKFDQRIEELDPRAAVYLVGVEDYSAGAAGIDQFKTDLLAYIRKAVKLRSGSGFAMIQTPYPNASSENDELYAQAVRDVMDELTGSIRSNVVLVDHNSVALADNCYNADGSLSGIGHYELGKQLAAAVCGNTNGYQTMPEVSVVAAPASYSDVAPTVTSENNDLVIAGLEDIAWTVEIALESYTLTVQTAGSILAIENLPAGEDYVLTITAADLSVRLPIMAGTINGGAGSEYAPELNANQQDIADLVGGEEPLTWLFMGDSITHGAAYTFGYDSISQIFEKFVKDDLGRTDDTVINTAVSSADTSDTLDEIHSRLNRYQPDVVSIMIGTNDSANHIPVTVDQYKTNLRAIIAAIQAKGAKVILRTPVVTKSTDSSRNTLGSYVAAMREVAAEYDDVIFVEQYSNMEEAFTAAPYMKNLLFNSGDILHPTTEGQTWMMHRFLEATGLTQDGYIANLWYDYSSRTVSEVEPPVTFADGTATMDTAALASAYGQALYEVKLMANDGLGNVYSVEGKAGDVLSLKNLPDGVFFTAEARVASNGTWVTFGVPKTIDVEVFVGRTQTVGLEGTVIPDIDGVKDIAAVTYASKVMGKAALDNTFSDGYVALADCEYTFTRQSDGTYLISAVVDGTTVYIDPHAGAGNAGYPNRTHQSAITLESGTNGGFKFHQMNEGYLHFWDNDDSKLYWDQCSADGGHTGHNIYIYRQAENGSTEVPGYEKVTNANDIVSGGKYLIVAKANSGGYYALRPCKTTSNKYQHICKVGGTVTELTIQGIAVGNGTIYAGNNVINVAVVDSENIQITLNYNYEGAPGNGSLTVATGAPIGQLPVPMRPGYTFFGWYLGGSKVTSSYVVTESVTLTADWVTVSTKEKPADGTTTNGQPFPVSYANGDAYCYRIPGIVTLADGTVVAMADARWNTWADCGGLDTIISASKDNGKTWTYTYANYLGDNGDYYNAWSTTFIDPAIATDGETVYMIADLFPAGVSTMAHGYASQAGSGGFHANGKLMLRDLAGDTYKHGNSSEKGAYLSMATSRSYDFYLDPNTDGSYTIRRLADDSAVEGYTVDAMLNIRSADGSVDTHLFMADSPYQVYPTNYLYLTKSTDGLNWSAPELIVAKNASESALLIGPGSGTYDAVHGNMVFTAYSYSGSAASQRTCLLWAGADGKWHRSENATTDVWSSEASAVVLEDGTVRVFYRSGSNILCYSDYLWNGEEYVRDEKNTSVSTEAVKNSGNGCMLSAVKYPAKVNGREMIFVATPATSGSRSDGHVYGFYVNKDGSLKLVADYDVTPGSAEYYAYSCLTVLTKGEEAGDLALFWEDSWNSSPARATIHYDVLAIEDVLAGVEEVVRKEVSLTVGGTATFEDSSGYYVGENTSELDTDVATVQITGTVTETAMGAADAVSTIADGTYIIVNTRAGKPLTTGTASADGGNGLALDGSKDHVADSGVWTVKAVAGGYTVQDASGKYLTIGSQTAGLSTTESVVSIGRNGSTWTISRNGAYLNDFGGKSICAAGWQHSSAPTDAGSQWMIYTMEQIPVAGTSEITFTGVGEGQTEVLIGNVLYQITVSEASEPVENPFVDVPEGSYCFEPVLWAVEKGITTGTSEKHFSPERTCTRAEVVTFLWRAAGSPEPTTTANPFVDVPADSFCAKAVLWAVENGVTNGVDSNHFAPTENCNRAQVVTLLWRAKGSPAPNSTASFTDLVPGEFYVNAVSWAVENGITNGVNDTEFGAAQSCTRAQIVTFLYRAYK